MSPKNIKNNILTVISGLMCNDDSLRRVSEDRRKALEFTEEYALILIDIMMDFGEPIEERLMASILLKQYIVAYWEPEPEGKIQPIIPAEIKDKIKKFLPAGIGDSNRQLKLSTAHIMAHIGALDYPDQWPNMMNLVQQMLQSVSKEVVEGTVLFLRECLPYNIVTELGPTLFNCLYEICSNEKYSTNTRATVISLITIFLLSDLEHNENPAHDEILNEAGKKFCGLLAYHLSQPYSQHSDFQLKSEIIGGAFVQFLYCDKAQEPVQLILSTLPIMLEILSKCAAEYLQVIGCRRTMPVDADEDDHNPKFFLKLVTNIFALIQIIATDKNTSKRLSPILSDIFYAIMIFMTITPDIEQEFIEDEHSYCADEFNNMVNNTLRTDLKTMLCELTNHFPTEKIHISLSVAINKILGGSYEIKPNDSFNWRVNESVMCTIGCLSDVFKAQQTHHESFNIYAYLQNASMIVAQCRNVILLARIMLVVGRFSCCMSSEQVVNHLSTICINLRSDQHVLRNAAIRALNFHCQRISNLHGNCSQHATDNMQKQHLQALVDVFNSLLESLINVSEYLNPMIFGTTIVNICEITNLNENLTSNFASRLVPFILNTLAKNTHNALIINRCKDLIVGLSKNQFCGEYVQSSLLPPLLNLISNPCGSTDVDRTEEQAVGLYILSVLTENASSEAVRDALMMQGFMFVINSLNSTKDMLVTEMGSRCLCMYLLKCYRHFSLNERSTSETVMGVIYNLLEPARNELACKHIDKIVICAFKAFGEKFYQHNEKLVKCILSKANFSQSMEIKESFNVIFLHYFCYNYELITSLLNKVPGPTGESALKHVLSTTITFKYLGSNYGKYLQILVLCQMLESTLLREDARLKSIYFTEVALDGQQKEVSMLSYIFRSLIDKFLMQVKTQNVQDCDSDTQSQDDDSEVEDLITDQLIDLCTVLDEPITQKGVEDYLNNYMHMFAGHASFKTLADTYLDENQRQRLYSCFTESVQYY